MIYTHEATIDFGKHEGKMMKDVPRGYLLHLYDLGITEGPLADYIIDNVPVLRFVRDKQDKAA